jgi:hypothetical protein
MSLIYCESKRVGICGTTLAMVIDSSNHIEAMIFIKQPGFDKAMIFINIQVLTFSQLISDCYAPQQQTGFDFIIHCRGLGETCEGVLQLISINL